MRIAILGCGSIGKRHARNLTALGYRDLLLFDPVVESREGLATELEAQSVAQLGALWEQRPSIAFITAPSNLHMELALAAATHGCHLFIEKPLSHTRAGIDALHTLTRQAGLITMVGCNMRFHPGPAQIKRLLDEHAIGKPLAARIQAGSYLPNWRPGTDYRRSYSAATERGGGVLLDCIHEIDLALWYFGPGSLRCAVTLPATSIDLSVEGLAELLIQHHNGVLSSVHLNFIQRDYRRGCQIIGSDGSLYWDFAAGTVRQYNAAGEPAERFKQPIDWAINQMYRDELRYFLDCVTKQTTTFSTLDHGLAALELALAARSGMANTAALNPTM
jgi:predicted dehydrogenase